MWKDDLAAGFTVPRVARSEGTTWSSPVTRAPARSGWLTDTGTGDAGAAARDASSWMEERTTGTGAELRREGRTSSVPLIGAAELPVVGEVAEGGLGEAGAGPAGG